MIPPFDHNGVIPPHLGNPTDISCVSPYNCSILEFCQHFSTSIERITLLKNLISFRRKMNAFGIIKGFQWVDGSFIENVESHSNRPPNDIDVVTFYSNLESNKVESILSDFPEFTSPERSKEVFKLDHYPFDYSHSPMSTVDYTRYWVQLFSHNRSGVWKGIVCLQLFSELDNEAENYLNHLEL